MFLGKEEREIESESESKNYRGNNIFFYSISKNSVKINELIDILSITIKQILTFLQLSFLVKSLLWVLYFFIDFIWLINL